MNRKAIAAALRLRVLRLRADDLGIVPAARIDASQFFGLAIETAYDDSVVTLVALVDGSVSLYVSDGSGSIGCGAQTDVRHAARHLLRSAAQLQSQAVAVEDLAPPPPGSIRFYWLMPSGAHVLQARLDGLGRVDPALRSLYFAGERVVANIAQHEAGRSLAREIDAALSEMSAEQARIAPSSPAAYSELEKEACLSVGNAVRRLSI